MTRPADPEAIETLLTIAAILLTDAPGDTFTAAQLFVQLQKLAGSELIVTEADLQQGLCAADFLEVVEDRFRLR